MHRQIKVCLGHGMGNLLNLFEAAGEVLTSTARDFRLQEGIEKTIALQEFNGKQWAALELLARTRQQAQKMLKKEVPRGNCIASSRTCPICTQYGSICADRMADKIEANLPLEKADVHEVYWLDRDLSLDNPLLTVLLPKKVTATKGRPREMATFAADEDDIFGSRGKAMMGKKTTSTTTSLGRKVGDKTRATTASVHRINSAFEHSDTTLQFLDEDDTRSRNAQRRAVKKDQRLTAGLTKQGQPRVSKATICWHGLTSSHTFKQKFNGQKTANGGTEDCQPTATGGAGGWRQRGGRERDPRRD